jgi:tartrate dehydrogenase/decarboxylase/D-malate dehydrogenase
VTVTPYHVDALAARFVLQPESLDVVVGSNLFGDILTDLGGALQGSLGIPASANLNPEGRFPSLFEPVHGSAPDIAGRGIANPTAAIWAGSMMLEYLGEKDAAELVMNALERALESGRVRTPDLGGNGSTVEMADEVVRLIKTEDLSLRSP